MLHGSQRHENSVGSLYAMVVVNLATIARSTTRSGKTAWMSGNWTDAASHGTRSSWFQIGRFLLLLASGVAIVLLVHTMVHHRFIRGGRIDRYGHLRQI
jgi:hypothetical protein